MSVATESGLVQRTHALGATLEDLSASLERPRVFPITSADTRAILEASSDLATRVRQLQAEPSLLTVVFVGGTGVGKSTLLNALAGGRIAESSIARPTTTIPTVYHHEEVNLGRLDPVLGRCRAVSHRRPELRQKILVDTPDIDGNVREHHERLREVLPVADAVLYVGSQEKYHDREGWRILLAQRGSRGFAFVLNKWDRCQNSLSGQSGRAPDQDFRASLEGAGFTAPLIFRTCAASWVARKSGATVDEPIADDFANLERWLEAGLDERAIRDIKSRGIAGKIAELLALLERATAPDWWPKARTLEHEWHKALREAVADYANLLVEACDQSAPAFERHFGRLGRSHFRGMFGIYLNLWDRLSRVNLSVLPSATATETKIDELAARAVARIPEAARLAQRDTLHDHLLALADRRDWPIETFRRYLPDQEATRADAAGELGDAVLAEAISSRLLELEKEFSAPTGSRLATRLAAKGLCEWGPPVVAGLLALKWLYDSIFGEFWGLSGYLTALVFLGVVFGGLHFLLYKLVPVHWVALREQLRRLIENHLLERVGPRYLRAISEFSSEVQAERARLLATQSVLRDLRDQLRGGDGGGAPAPGTGATSPTSLFARTGDRPAR